MIIYWTMNAYYPVCLGASLTTVWTYNTVPAGSIAEGAANHYQWFARKNNRR